MALASHQLQVYQEQFEALKEEARVLVRFLDEEAFNWRPAPDRWSVAECLDHLNRAGRLLLPKLDDAIAQGRAGGLTGEGPFDYGWLGRWWIRSMQPVSRRRLRHPRAFAPSASRHLVEDVLRTFLTLQDDFIERIYAANGLDLRRIKAPSAAFSMLRLPIGAWFESTVAHEERHLAQARRVMAHPAFPLES
jgi:hypothetical protein